MEQFHQLNKILEDPVEFANQWKLQHGQKILGVFPSDVPEELIDSFDVYPFTLLGRKKTLATTGLIPSFACSLITHTINQSFFKELEFLDGIVVPFLCDSSRALFQIWKRNFPTKFADIIRFPKKLNSEGTKGYLVKELKRFKETLEANFKNLISDETIWRSIEIYNENRSYLRTLHSLRCKDSYFISNFDFYSLVKTSLLIPKKEHNKILKQVLKDIESLPRNTTSTQLRKVYLSGKLIEPFEIFQWLDELGILVSDDDLVTGSRYFSYEVERAGDPFNALAESYFHRIPDALLLGSEDRLRYITRKVHEYNLKGVIFIHLKFCEPLIYDYPDLKKGLDREGIPNLLIETEIQTSALGQIKTRLQAFAEILENKG